MVFTHESISLGGRKITIQVEINERALGETLVDNVITRAWTRAGNKLAVGRSTKLADGAIVATVTAMEQTSEV